MPIRVHIIQWAILTSKVCQTDLVFGVQSGFVTRSVVHDFKSLCIAVMICATLVNIKTERERHTGYAKKPDCFF